MKSLVTTPINPEKSKASIDKPLEKPSEKPLEKPTEKPSSATSAPPLVNSGSKQSLTDNVRRTSSSTESKVRCTISSDKLTVLRKNVDEAIREHKTFTIKGGWQTLRNQFIQRGWVEKYEASASAASKQQQQQKGRESAPQTLEEVCNNLPLKQDWESPTQYVLKCERTVMSRMLQNHSVDFYWNMRREPTDWHHRVNTHQIMNRFARSLFTSKEGLNLLLHQLHWYSEPGVSNFTYPRCYTLGFPEHYHNFVDDFRLTACLSLLKWFVQKYEDEDEYAIKSPEGRVPYTALQFAIDRCNDYLAVQRHLDIDRDVVKTWNHEWDQFLSNYFKVVHEHHLFLDSHEWTIPLFNAAARTTLNEMKKVWPMMDSDGMNNIWILKPGNKCRGRGIQLVKQMEDVQRILNLKVKYVIQKYVERPLLIYQTKFDIRQWFLLTSVQPLMVWMYRECYLRFSTQIFSLDNFHESLHLTNHAVQCKYANVMQRDKALPEQNMWDNHMFQTYLAQIGQAHKWEEVVYPGMRENIVGVMLACQDSMDRRPNTFELYGADFVIGEDFQPWLLEINSSPDLSPSTNVTSRLCPQVLQDIVKVVVDKRRNQNADTGMFDLVYKQSMHRSPAYLGMNLSIRGRRLFKGKKNKAKEQKDKENKETQQQIANLITANLIPSSIIPKCIPKMLSPDLYKGPVIGDLIEELHHSLYPSEPGYEFIPALPPASAPKKKNSGVKHERVSKTSSHSLKNKTNKYFVNRKANVKENSKLMDIGYRKTRSMFIKSAYFGLFHEWKLKNKFALNHNQESIENSENIWGKDTSSILKGKTFSSKFNMPNLNTNGIETNKTSIRTPSYCLSSINLSLSLPQLHKIEPQFTLDFSNTNALSDSKISPDDKKAKSAKINGF